MAKIEFQTVRRKVKKFTVNMVDNPALILMYHRVAELRHDSFGLAVSPDNFSRQIEYLSNHYNVLEAEEFAHLRKQKKKLPRKSIVITFDDGYLDNYEHAMPILEHFEAHASFFIATANLGRKNDFWSDALGRVFYETELLPDGLKVEIEGNMHSFDTSTEQGRLTTFRSLHPMLMRMQPLLREELVGVILDWAGLSRAGRETHLFMTTEEVKRLGKSPIATIGAHTHNHPQLSAFGKKDQHEEISKSFDVLQAITERPVKYFAYPYGSASNYDSNSIAVCKSLGVELAYGGWGILYRWSDNYQLPRMNVGDWDIDTFKAKLDFLI